MLALLLAPGQRLTLLIRLCSRELVQLLSQPLAFLAFLFCGGLSALEFNLRGDNPCHELLALLLAPGERLALPLRLCSREVVQLLGQPLALLAFLFCGGLSALELNFRGDNPCHQLLTLLLAPGQRLALFAGLGSREFVQPLGEPLALLALLLCGSLSARELNLSGGNPCRQLLALLPALGQHVTLLVRLGSREIVQPLREPLALLALLLCGSLSLLELNLLGRNPRRQLLALLAAPGQRLTLLISLCSHEVL